LFTHSYSVCLGRPRRAATSVTLKPRSSTCLTASALNSAVYCHGLWPMGVYKRLAGPLIFAAKLWNKRPILRQVNMRPNV
jgi:hypothetical protein